MIFSIDPGNVQSAYSIINDNLKPIQFGKIDNADLLQIIYEYDFKNSYFAIEMISCYGMAVGATTFETVFWIGRFWEACNCKNKRKIYRKDVKINLCSSMKAKDANIRQSLIDRFGDVGVKANQGWFYGFKADIWSSYAVGITFYDLYKDEEKINV